MKRPSEKRPSEKRPVEAPPEKLPRRDANAHKGTFGRVLLIGGSRGMAGSIALSSIAALHTGSGLVAAAVPDCILETVASFHPAIMTLPWSDDGFGFATEAAVMMSQPVRSQAAIGCGPGMTTGAGSVAIVDNLLTRRPCPIVMDADAINVIAREGWLRSNELFSKRDLPSLVLTPHAGELARLVDVPPDRPDEQLAAALRLADSFDVTIVVKGGPTRVVGRDGVTGETTVWTNNTGNPGMATAGCGDVLTGVITSLLGQGLDGMRAAKIGVWIHGHAGDRAAAATSRAGMTAVHLLDQLPAAMTAISVD